MIKFGQFLITNFRLSVLRWLLKIGRTTIDDPPTDKEEKEMGFRIPDLNFSTMMRLSAFSGTIKESVEDAKKVSSEGGKDITPGEIIEIVFSAIIPIASVFGLQKYVGLMEDVVAQSSQMSSVILGEKNRISSRLNMINGIFDEQKS